jgi:hypothetical protein
MNRRSHERSSRRKWVQRRVPVTVRLPERLIKEIDHELDNRDVPLSRNNWLLEAAIEKLRKNGAGGHNGTK